MLEDTNHLKLLLYNSGEIKKKKKKEFIFHINL
jgi:hypothetical protein